MAIKVGFGEIAKGDEVADDLFFTDEPLDDSEITSSSTKPREPREMVEKKKSTAKTKSKASTLEDFLNKCYHEETFQLQ